VEQCVEFAKDGFVGKLKAIGAFTPREKRNMSDQAIQKVQPLGHPWVTADPFLFCVHHNDAYPKGNEYMGPDASLSGRRLGNDFGGKDGWSMYHGRRVPGFPQHPHRGFETITIARRGYIDHSDSLGAAARFGEGDVQWMTAGTGVVHSEMFPLVHQDQPNPTELFQIWLNLPAKDKHVAPYFTMFWSDTIPSKTFEDAQGHQTHMSVVAGTFEGMNPPAPPPDSWASREQSDIAIWTLKMEADAEWTIPAGPAGANRMLYFFEGESFQAEGRKLSPGVAITLDPTLPLTLNNGKREAEFLVLQGRPIGDPVVQYGPFVMNSMEDIQKTIHEFNRTGFGGWPWEADAPVHPREKGRFAKHPDGRLEEPETL
tara:strand:+ start:693 stop:1805 length:1113 start_codon:yes stop_codon:yes gene_type:complete